MSQGKTEWEKLHGHVLHGPEDHPDDGSSDRCQVCVLSLCKTCGGAEGSMPTSCPGMRMTNEQADAVYTGLMDYFAGEWHSLKTY